MTSATTSTQRIRSTMRPRRLLGSMICPSLSDGRLWWSGVPQPRQGAAYAVPDDPAGLLVALEAVVVPLEVGVVRVGDGPALEAADQEQGRRAGGGELQGAAV